MEANEYGCLSQALTVAAMLSAETALLPGRRLEHGISRGGVLKVCNERIMFYFSRSYY